MSGHRKHRKWWCHQCRRDIPLVNGKQHQAEHYAARLAQRQKPTKESK